MSRDIVNKGSGLRGQRSFDLAAHHENLKGFSIHKSDTLSKVFGASYSVSVGVDRNSATITIPDFNTGDYLMPPQGATHVKFIGIIGSISEHLYSNNGKGYEPTVRGQNGRHQSTHSLEIAIGGTLGGDVVLSPAFAGLPVIDAKVAVLVGLGIEFLQEIDGAFYLLASSNALQIIETA